MPVDPQATAVAHPSVCRRAARAATGLAPLLAAGLALAALSCSKKDPSGPQAPVCVMGATTLDFGTVVVGESRDRTVTMSNTGTATLPANVFCTCADFTLPAGSSFMIPPGGSTAITVRFSPSAGGSQDCTLDTDLHCANVSLLGIGTTTGCEVAPTSIEFYSVGIGKSVDASFTIRNIGGSASLAGTVTSPVPEIAIVGSADYDLAPGDSVRITVRFSPSDTVAYAALLDTGSGCQDVTIKGAGIEIDSGNLPPSQSYAHTFNRAGTYRYHCEIHPVMRGTVVVDPSGPMSAAVRIVNATASGFTPPEVTVAPGGTVTWTNNASGPHTVTSD